MCEEGIFSFKKFIKQEKLEIKNFRNRKISLYLWSWRANLQIKYESYKTVLLRDPAGQKGCNKDEDEDDKECADESDRNCGLERNIVLFKSCSKDDKSARDRNVQESQLDLVWKGTLW